jgi:AcrR family transcriptional regulator
MSDLVQRRKAMAEELMHDAICAAATAVLAEVGFAALTMERVAEAAGVSKGTLYNYYQDKDALVLEVVEQTFAPLTEAVDELLASSAAPLEKLTGVVRLLLAGVDERRALGRALCAADLSPCVGAVLRAKQMRVWQRFVEEFRQAKAAQQLRAECSDPEALGRLLAVILDGVIHERMLHGNERPPVDREVGEIEEFVLRSWFKETR